MIQKSILEQISSLIKIFTSNKNLVLISVIAIVAFIALEVMSHLNKKKMSKIILISIYTLVFGLLLIFYHSEIMTFVDYLINNIFIFLFFPNLAVYTLVIIVSNILVIKSLLERKGEIIKNISIIFFILFNIIFYLIVENCLKNNVLIYENLSIYTNNELLTLIEVSMYLFIIYLSILLINKISISIIKSIKVEKKVLTNYEFNYEPNKLKIDDVVPKKVKTDIPELIPNFVEIKAQTSNSDNLILNNDLKSNTICLKKDEVNNLKTVNQYSDYMDIEPVKKQKIELSNMDDIFIKKDIYKDMDVLFGEKKYLDNIMNDISKLKENINNQSQIRKIYEQININSGNLTLNDYNCLINALKEIKNNTYSNIN